MNSITLGNSGVAVSQFCLGAMFFGTRTGKETSYELLDQYVDAGGSFLDTANIYARWVSGFKGGESETVLGGWLRERRNRSRMFIASKVGVHYPGVESGLRAQQIKTECEKSLKRMGIEVIDLYYAHLDDRHTPLEETMEAFDRLVREGKVRLLGASNYRAWRLEEARWVSRTNEWADFCCIQQRHSYVRPRTGTVFGTQIAANVDLLDYCHSRGVTLLAYSPLLGGAYTRPDREFPEQYRGADTDARALALERVARELGVSPNQVVLAWMAQSDPPVIPLVAASTVEQMAENLGALAVQLNPRQMEALNSAAA
jgi:aryl-alcohol dehydrogenase-like predicted oxidoreductase